LLCVAEAEIVPSVLYLKRFYEERATVKEENKAVQDMMQQVILIMSCTALFALANQEVIDRACCLLPCQDYFFISAQEE